MSDKIFQNTTEIFEDLGVTNIMKNERLSEEEVKLFSHARATAKWNVFVYKLIY